MAVTPITTTKPDTGNPDDIRAWETAVAEAKKAGIYWQRPDDDKRSAQDIIDSNPLLKNLGNQGNENVDLDGDGDVDGVKDMLKIRAGDFEHDADAAFRAAQILEHVEKFDENGNRLVGDDIGNGSINGFTKGGDAKHGTEAGRLQDFGKYGFSNLKGELNHVTSAGDDRQAREEAEKLGIKWDRPEGDDRSAKDIIDANPLLKNLGNQSGVKDMLKERVGDFENDANAAYRAVQVLQHVEKFDGEGNKIAGNDVNNGSIDGFTSSDEARHGTEAGRLQDFGKYGFSSLKGKLTDVGSVGEDKAAREEAEKLGFKWQRPDGDKRSAKDIIDANPLLKNLGNQSGVKDMLKERVGDFENDADAAYRAAQVLDRVVMFDEKGNSLSGGDVANSSIDGFTSSAEARNGTEAGRLQDFGKYGYSVFKELPSTDEIGSYKDFVKNNPDADETSKKVAKYAAILGENYDIIRGKTGSGDYLTSEALQKYKNENTHLSDEVKEALDFWSQPGAFEQLDTAQNPLGLSPDGKAGKQDLSNWIKTYAPKDAGSVMSFISGIADGNAASKVDTSGLTKDIFENPQNYSTEQKAAVLKELLDAQQLIVAGGAAGMWRDDKSKVQIANIVRSHPDPEKLLQDVNDHIQTLQSDPEVVKFMSENFTTQMTKMLEDNKGLKDALTKTYQDDIKSGKALDSLWETKSKDGVSQQAILAEFVGTAQSYQSALGIKGAADLQGAVKNSKHNGELQDYYEKSLASGDRLKELLKDNSFEEATSAFSMEVALYNAALDPEFTAKFDTKLNENFSAIAQENVFKGASFEDMKKAFGINGGDELDEAKVRSIIEQISKENPQLLLNENGTVSTPDQVLSAFRGNWDMFRQGTKTFDKSTTLSGLFGPPSAEGKGAYDRGVLHSVSGLFMAGITIARGAGSGGKLTDRQIVDITTGSVQTATLLAEGGAKGYQNYLKGLKGKIDDELMNSIGSLLDDPSPENLDANDRKTFNGRLTDNVKKFEEAAKGIGGLAGVAMGAFSIFDGVRSIRKGDTVKGGLSITTGALTAMAGLASAVEGGLGVLGATVPRIIPVMAGVLGWAAAGIGVLATLLPGLIEEGQQETKVDKFAYILEDHLTKYEIDGVKNGDIWDIPDDEWPGNDDTTIAS
jgi:hypothetical protein